MAYNIIADSICVLRVKVETETGFDGRVAGEIEALGRAAVCGAPDPAYPFSLIDKISKSVGHILNIEVSGPRSALAIPLRLIKGFAPECGAAFSSKIGDGGCAKAIKSFLKNWGILDATQTAANADSHLEFKCVGGDGNLTECVIKKSPSRAFRHSFDLAEIEARTGAEFNAMLLNRPRAGFWSALQTMKKRPNSIVSLIVHDYSKYQRAADYVPYIGESDFVFITAEDSDKSVSRLMARELGAGSYEELGEAVASLGGKRRMFLLPPKKEARGAGKFVEFFQTGLPPVKAEIPDKIRLKTKTAWLNGACVALACKDWGANPPFELDGHLPATLKDLEAFANWAVQMAYFGYPPPNFKPANSLIIK